jgi:hypothetical protein
MRILGIALVACALALGAGGVSVRRAGADEPSAAAEKPSIEVIEYPAKAPAAAEGAKNSCPAATPGQSPIIVRIPRERLNAEGFQALNTLGYNYRQPDDPPDRFVPSAAQPGAPAPQP